MQDVRSQQERQFAALTDSFTDWGKNLGAVAQQFADGALFSGLLDPLSRETRQQIHAWLHDASSAFGGVALFRADYAAHRPEAEQEGITPEKQPALAMLMAAEAASGWAKIGMNLQQAADLLEGGAEALDSRGNPDGAQATRDAAHSIAAIRIAYLAQQKAYYLLTSYAKGPYDFLGLIPEELRVKLRPEQEHILELMHALADSPLAQLETLTDERGALAHAVAPFDSKDFFPVWAETFPIARGRLHKWSAALEQQCAREARGMGDMHSDAAFYGELLSAMDETLTPLETALTEWRNLQGVLDKDTFNETHSLLEEALSDMQHLMAYGNSPLRRYAQSKVDESGYYAQPQLQPHTKAKPKPVALALLEEEDMPEIDDGWRR